jgi:uncharacterized membrane protein YagU involved in acid resistance
MNATRAVAAGLLGTAAMTALLLVEPSVGLPQIAIGQILSTALGLVPAYLTVGPAFGWCLDFLAGVAFALLYAGVFERRLPGGPLVRGALYGIIVFVVAQLVFTPLVGGGVFSHGDLEMIAGSLLGHLVYGAVVGWIYGLPSARAPGVAS